MFLEFFTDSILRGPTLGSLFMGAACGLVGTFTFLQKKSLIAETLSHAIYPGAMLAILCGGAFFHLTEGDEGSFTLLILLFSLLSSLLTLKAIHYLKSLSLPTDAIFCFLIALTFGIGVTLASWLQFRFSSLYRSAESYLFGQTATMTDFHIFLFGGLFLFISGFIYLFFKEIKAFLFDKEFAKVMNLPIDKIENGIQFLLIFSLILGMRATGALLMSALLIAPPIAARQLTNRLDTFFILSSFFGAMSGFFGNVICHLYESTPPLPTGPTIVLLASFFALTSLFYPVFKKLKEFV